MSELPEPRAKSLPPPLSAQDRCPFCSEMIIAGAKKCRYCGEMIDPALRAIEELKSRSQQPMVFMNAGGGGGASAVSSNQMGGYGDIVGRKSRGAAAMLAFLLGGLGAHKFYLGRPIQGLVYLLFCWTYVPFVIAFIEGIVYLCTNPRSFALKYG